MSDNGPEFSTIEFIDFSNKWKFEHMTSSPRYPQSNGQVERAIQTVKNILRKTAYDQSDFNLGLLEFSNTPTSSEIPSPAELLNNRKLRSIVPCTSVLLQTKVHKSAIKNIKKRQRRYKHYYDKGTRILKPLNIGQNVKVRMLNQWVPGTVSGSAGLRSYKISMLHNGHEIRRNRKHIIIDSNRTHNSLPLQQCKYDDIMIGPAAAMPSSSSSEPVLRFTDNIDNNCFRTRSGRTVRPPDRWGYE